MRLALPYISQIQAFTEISSCKALQEEARFPNDVYQGELKAVSGTHFYIVIFIKHLQSASHICNLRVQGAPTVGAGKLCNPHWLLVLIHHIIYEPAAQLPSHQSLSPLCVTKLTSPHSVMNNLLHSALQGFFEAVFAKHPPQKIARYCWGFILKGMVPICSCKPRLIYHTHVTQKGMDAVQIAQKRLWLLFSGSIRIYWGQVVRDPHISWAPSNFVKEWQFPVLCNPQYLCSVTPFTYAVTLQYVLIFYLFGTHHVCIAWSFSEAKRWRATRIRLVWKADKNRSCWKIIWTTWLHLSRTHPVSRYGLCTPLRRPLSPPFGCPPLCRWQPLHW